MPLVPLDRLHEEEAVTLVAETARPVPVLWKALRASGFKQDGDVFIIPRNEADVPRWQHDVLVEVLAFHDGKEVFDRQESWDTAEVAYPLARVPESGIEVFVEKTAALSDALGLPMRYGDAIVTRDELRSRLNAAADDLRATVGRPGSEEVALEIEMHYPRRS